jgi:outer membrane protein
MFRQMSTLAILLLMLICRVHAQNEIPATTPSNAQQLSLDEAIRTALQKHPALRESEAAVEAAEAEVKQARANYFPQLSFSGIGKVGLSGATGALGLPGFPASPFYRNAAYSANWYQAIFDFGRTKHFVAMERAFAEVAALKNKSEEQRIVLEVRRAYFAVLEAQELQLVAGETVKDRDLTLARAQAYYSAQLGSKLDADLAQANMAEAQGNLIQAKNATATAFAALRFAMGVDGMESYELQPLQFEKRALPPLDHLLQTGLTNRPDAQALQLKVRALGERVGFARSKRLPSVNGFGAGGQGRFNGTTVKQEQRHGVGALGLFFPVFTGGRLKAEREEAQAELEGATAAKDQLNQQIRLEITRTYFELQDVSERMSIAEEQEKAAKQALALAQARNQAQLGSFLDVVTAEVAETKAKTNYARTLYDYKRAEAQLDFAVGKEVKP